MRPLLTDKTAFISAAAFSVALGISVYFEFFWLALIPVIILIGWFGFTRLDRYITTLLLAVPLSLNLQEFGINNIGLYMPTEPMLFAGLMLFIFLAFRGWPVDKRIFFHPITYIIMGMMLWMAISTINSYDHIVSIKFMTSRAWFIVSFFFFLGHIMLKNPAYRERMIMYLLFPLSIVVLYTLIRHAGYGFDKHHGHWVMKPFFKDHTSYGAVLAMLLPPSIALLIKKNRPPLLRVFLALSTTIITLGVLFSFTRAAWVSLAGVALLLAAIKMGFRWRTLVGVGALMLVFVWFSKDALLIQMQRNKQDSSDNLTEHVESISNVSSDDSNLERLNRWSCALALFKERPILGWGPGTFQFVYAPFQEARLRTVISTNNADRGNAHSEYLGPLAEQGLFGGIIMLLLFWYASVVGFRLWRRIKDTDERNLAISVYLGLMTYFIHGVLNNYLDTDKASAPFWGFLALLVVLDIESSLNTDSKKKLVKSTT